MITVHDMSLPRRRKSNVTVKETDKEIQFTEKKHASLILQLLNSSRQEEGMCDVILVVSGVRILAHRAVLMVCSDYFRAMFSINMRESTSHEVPLLHTGLDSSAVKLIVDYLYTGTLTAEPDQIQNLLIASDMLQILAIKTLCENYLLKCIDMSNCLDMLQLGEQFQCPELCKRCTALVKQRFAAVSREENFVALPASVLMHLLHFDDLSLGSSGESIVISGILRWFEKDPNNRLFQTKEAFSHVRWKSVPNTTVQELLQHPSLVEYNQLKDAVEHCSKASLLGPRQAHKAIVVVGGYLQSHTGPLCPRLNSAEMLDLSSLEWKQFPSLPIPLPSSVHTVVINGRLLCIVLTFSPGDSEAREFEDLFEYNSIQDSWDSVVIANKQTLFDIVYKCVKEHGVVTFDNINGRLYCISHQDISYIELKEQDSDLCLSSVRSLPVIPRYHGYSWPKRVDMLAVCCKGVLYCAGGSMMESQSELYPQRDLFMYNQATDTWEEKASMIEARSKGALVELDGYIYAVGGFNTFRINTAERYSPDTDTWTMIGSMEKQRSHLSCVAAAGKIYALGGETAYHQKGGRVRKVLKLCEVYDPVIGCWSSTPYQMEYGRCMAGAAVL